MVFGIRCVCFVSRIISCFISGMLSIMFVYSLICAMSIHTSLRASSFVIVARENSSVTELPDHTRGISSQSSHPRISPLVVKA
jgi:hypothetical protein